MVVGHGPLPAYSGPKEGLTDRYVNRDFQAFVAVTGPVTDDIGPEHTPVGYLSMDQHHQVGNVSVRPDLRRKGIATALWHAARDDFPDLRHSDEMTVVGKAWVTSLGDWLPARAAVLIPPLPDPWNMSRAQLVLQPQSETGCGVAA